MHGVRLHTPHLPSSCESFRPSCRCRARRLAKMRRRTAGSRRIAARAIATSSVRYASGTEPCSPTPSELQRNRAASLASPVRRRRQNSISHRCRADGTAGFAPVDGDGGRRRQCRHASDGARLKNGARGSPSPAFLGCRFVSKSEVDAGGGPQNILVIGTSPTLRSAERRARFEASVCARPDGPRRHALARQGRRTPCCSN